MSKKQRNESLVHLPTTIIFTPAGRSLFKDRPIVLKTVQNQEGEEREGLNYSSYNPDRLQRMLLAGYVEEMHLCLADVVARRKSIRHTNTLILEAILFRKLNPALASMLEGSPILQDYNERNPGTAVDRVRQIPAREARDWLGERPQLQAYIQNDIREQVERRIGADEGISPADREVRVRVLSRLSERIDERIWYLYCMVYKTPLGKRLKSGFTGMLVDFLRHASVILLLNDVFLESMGRQEEAFLKAIQSRVDPEGKMDEFLPPDYKRKELLEEAGKLNLGVTVGWNLSTERSAKGRVYVLYLQTSCEVVLSEGARKYMAERSRKGGGISLAEFYMDALRDHAGASLVLPFDSRLEALCRQENKTMCRSPFCIRIRKGSPCSFV